MKANLLTRKSNRYSFPRSDADDFRPVRAFELSPHLLAENVTREMLDGRRLGRHDPFHQIADG